MAVPLYTERCSAYQEGRVRGEAEQNRDGLGPRGGMDRPVRADARRNIETLLEAAMKVFAVSGVDAPAREIAEKAGVGVGTLYRHFPKRSDLIVAVFRNEVDACADAAPILAAEHEPGDALNRWLQCYLDFIAAKRGLSAALHSGNPAFELLRSISKKSFYRRSEASWRPRRRRATFEPTSIRQNCCWLSHASARRTIRAALPRIPAHGRAAGRRLTLQGRYPLSPVSSTIWLPLKPPAEISTRHLFARTWIACDIFSLPDKGDPRRKLFGGIDLRHLSMESRGKGFFIWICCNPLKSPGLAKRNPRKFKQFSLDLFGFTGFYLAGDDGLL